LAGSEHSDDFAGVEFADFEELLQGAAREQDRTRAEAEHAEVRRRTAQEAFSAFGESWFTVDVMEWLMANNVNTVAGDGLLKILKKHGLGEGLLAPEMDSIYKLHKHLDNNPTLPFLEHGIEAPGWPGIYKLYRRDICEVIAHLFAIEGAAENMDLQPRCNHAHQHTWSHAHTFAMMH
jgi:hypothetical protein